MFKLLLSLTLMAGKADTLSPLRITNLHSGDKDSRTVYIGINNTFRIDDSTITGMVYHERARLSENGILVIHPVSTGNITLTLLRGDEKVDLDLRARILGLPTASPRSALNDTLIVDSLERDPIMDFASPDRDDLLKGCRVVSFTANLNNKNYYCRERFTPELLEACRQAETGSNLRITELNIAHPEAPVSMQVRCNRPFTLKNETPRTVASH